MIHFTGCGKPFPMANISVAGNSIYVTHKDGGVKVYKADSSACAVVHARWAQLAADVGEMQSAALDAAAGGGGGHARMGAGGVLAGKGWRGEGVGGKQGGGRLLTHWLQMLHDGLARRVG